MSLLLSLSRWRRGYLIAPPTLLLVLSVAMPAIAARETRLIGGGAAAIARSIANKQECEGDNQNSNPALLAEYGKNLYEAGCFSEAVAVWEQTAEAFARQGDAINEAMALSNLSLSYQQLAGQEGSVEDRLEFWERAKEAIALSQSLLETPNLTTEGQRVLAQTLEVLGSLQLAVGKQWGALETWEKATKIYSQLGNRERITRSLINQAGALQDLGRYSRACKAVLQALELDVPDCQTLTRFSQKLQALNPPADSLLEFEGSAELVPEFAELTEQLQKLKAQTASSLKFDGLRSFGDILRATGNLKLSEEILQESLAVAEELQSPQDQSTALLSLGNTVRARVEREALLPKELQDLNVLLLEPPEALKFYRQAAERATLPTTQVQARLNQLSLLLEKQQWFADGEASWFADKEELATARELWLWVRERLNGLPPNRIAIYSEINFARSLIKLPKKVKDAIASKEEIEGVIEGILVRARERAESLGDERAEAHALGSLGFMYENREDWPRAQSFTQQALDLAPAYQSPDIAYQFSWQLGRIRRAVGDIEGAIAAYTLAYETLQSLRGELVAIAPEVQFSFRDSVEPVYRELVALNLEQYRKLKDSDKEESQARLKQARTVIESLQLAELNNFFKDACVEGNLELIDETDETAAVIYPIILEDQLELIVSFPENQRNSLRLYAPKDSETNQAISDRLLTETLKDLQQGNATLNSPIKNEGNFLPLTQKLYDWLIRPIEADLQKSKVKTLVFVLDGELRNIPMSVLHDRNQYLIEKYAIALTPGLQLLNPQPLVREQLQALAGGAYEKAPSFEAAGNLAALPDVKDEVNEIMERVPRTEPLLNADFTRQNLQDLINQVPFPVVHLATHGQFSSNAENTFILTWDDRIQVTQLDNLLRRRDQNRPIELLVLSACETASGDNRAALGLAGVAVRAGARSTLATLWQVSDESTAAMMGDFYKGLASSSENLNKAEALRRAQVALLQQEKYQHPFYWAPYVMVGNWQ